MTAAAILSVAGLYGLGNDELEDLCNRFGVEPLGPRLFRIEGDIL
jgi:hypothetical protein